MAEKNLYKIIALLVALFIYLGTILSFVQYIKRENKLKKDYGFNVEEAIVVNIDSLLKEEPKPVEKLKPVEIPQPVIKPTPIPIPEPKEEVKPIILPPDPDPIPEEEEESKEVKDSRDKEAKSAKDLFSTVRTDEYKKAMREREKQEAARASRLKKERAERLKREQEKREREKRRREEASKAQKLVEQMQISKPSEHKKSGEEHEYWSFVSNKIMAKWEKTIATEGGLSATVTIRIDSKGRLTYKDLKSSYNSLFDTKLKVFLDNLEYERFPSYKHGPYIEAEFEFKDKEKGI